MLVIGLIYCIDPCRMYMPSKARTMIIHNAFLRLEGDVVASLRSSESENLDRQFSKRDFGNGACLSSRPLFIVNHTHQMPTQVQ